MATAKKTPAKKAAPKKTAPKKSVAKQGDDVTNTVERNSKDLVRKGRATTIAAKAGIAKRQTKRGASWM